MDRRRAAGALLALAACVAYATAAPTASNHTSLDLYDGAPDGCYYNFQHYGEGDRIMTNEPCLNCTCHNRMLMCYLRVCPFTKPIGQDCTIEKRADQCCPIVTCPDVPVDLLTSTTTSPAEYGATGLGKLDKFGCSIHGKYFPEGSKVPPTPNKPCEHCYCIRNMTTCVMQECTLHVDGCTPIYHKDVCCPVRYSCDHPEDEMPLLDDLSTTVRPTPGFLLTTTTLSPVTQMSQDCLYENQIIPDGALIKTEKACDHCYCMKGDIVCVVQECGTPMENEGKNCTAMPPRQGVCCPDTYICEGDETTTGIYDGLDYTTEIDQEKLTSLTPPRRAGSEGSGYRNEPDDIPNTESPNADVETEGSGDDQATIHSTVGPAATESHKIESTEATMSSTEEPNEFIPITSTKEPVSEYSNISDKQKDITEPFVPSTSSYTSQDRDESSTVKGLDEDIGSGDEDFITPQEIDTSSSDLPFTEESKPTVASELNIVTTESHRESSETFNLKTTTIEPMVENEDKTYLPSVATEKTEIEVTTLRHYPDEKESAKPYPSTDEALQTERDILLTTTSVPTIEDSERKTTKSGEKDNTAYQTDAPSESVTKTTLVSDYSTSAPGVEEEISTESHDAVADSNESTGADVDSHHIITMTTSTPLLEEIEKETTEEMYKPDESTPEKLLPSTSLPNISTDKTTDKDSFKPDLADEIISTNLPSTVSDLDSDEVASTEPEFESVEMSSEKQQDYPTTIAPVFEDDHKKITKLDDKPTNEPEKNQDIEISSEPQQYSPTTNAPSLDVFKETTKSDSLTTKESERVQDVEMSSEAQQHIPTSDSDDYIKKTTQLDYVTTVQPETVDDFNVSTESQRYPPTTSAPGNDEIINKITESESAMTDDAGISEQVEISTESQPPATIVPVFEGDKISESESSESEQDSSTTSASVLEEESKKTTPSDYSVTEEIDIHHSISHSTTTLQQTEFTTAEPDKGLNTIPSGSLEEETTKSTESVTELGNKFNDERETTTNTNKHTTLVTEHSVSSEDQFTLTTESAVHDMTDTEIPVRINENDDKTTVAIGVTDEIMSTTTHSQSFHTESPLVEQEADTSIPSTTEKLKEAGTKQPSSTSGYEYTTKATGLEDDSNIDKHKTSASSYETTSGSTTVSLEENEIIIESRIPGEGDCLLNGVTYRNESVVPSTNKCQSGCRCISSIIKCDPIICSPPPDYMDNCQTTYDSPDSCCPTYVCDHKTETLPPQSHSQMTGTEKEPPIQCNGDECVPSSNLPELPELPTVDNDVKCAGGKCAPSDQLCNEEGCQASPVKPCEGNECEVTSANIPPQKQQPCANGEDCGLPVVPGCGAGDCKSDKDTSHKIPQDNIDFEEECTEKSCKRKDDSVQVQQVPQMCSDGECQLTLDHELTTSASISSDKEQTLEVTTETGKLDTVTENIPEEQEHTEKDSGYKPPSESEVTHPTITTYHPEFLEKDKKQDITESSVLHESTQAFVEKLETETPTTTTEKHVTVKEDVTQFEPDDSVSTGSSDKATHSIEEITHPPKATSEPQEVTKKSEEAITHETPTAVKTDSSQMFDSDTQTTKSSKEEVLDDTSITEEIFTEAPKRQTESSEISESTADLTTVNADILTTVSGAHDTGSLEVTKTPIISQNEEELTTKLPEKTTDSLDYETTKFLDSSGAEKMTSPADMYDSDLHTTTSSKPIEGDEVAAQISDKDVTESPDLHEADKQVTTESSTESEEVTAKSEDKIVSQTENVIIQEVTNLPEDNINEEITTHSFDSQSTESPQFYDSEVMKTTKYPYIEKATTADLQDLRTETPKPSDLEAPGATEYPKEIENAETSTGLAETVSDETSLPQTTEKQDVSQFSDVTKDEVTTQATEQVSKETNGEDAEKYTKSTEATESGKTTSTFSDKTTTEASNVDINEVSTKSEEKINVIITEATPVTESSKLDGISHDETVTVKATTDETSTKSSEYESPLSTKSPDAFDSEKITTQITTEESDKMPSDMETHGVPETSSEESDTQQQSEITTPKTADEEHKLDAESHSLEKITTAPDTEITTQKDSTKPDQTDVNELTEKQEQSQTTKANIELITDSIIKSTTASPVSLDSTEEHVTSHIQQDIPTKAPIDIITEQESSSKTTDSPYQHSVDSELSPTEGISPTEKTVTILPEIQETRAPDLEKEITTDAGIKLDEITQKPLSTSISEDDTLHETDKYATHETTTLKSSDVETDQQPGMTESPKEESIDTEAPTREEISTIHPIAETQTKLPLDSEIIPTGHGDESSIHEHSPTEPSKMDTQENDQLEAEAPTLIPEYAPENSATEKPVHGLSSTEKSNENDEYSTPSELDDSLPTKSPSYPTSTTTRQENVDAENTDTIKISDSTTEASNLSDKPTVPSGSYDMNTEKSPETNLDSEVTDHIEIETSTRRVGTEHIETETKIPETSIDQESSTEHQLSTDFDKLSTESPTGPFTEVPVTKITTQTTLDTEPFTEPEKQFTKESEMASPETEDLVPTQSTATETAQPNTKAQDLEDTPSKDSDLSVTIPSVVKTTELPEAIEITSKVPDMTTQLVEDTEKPSENEYTSTSKQEFIETTTSNNIEDETVVPVDKNVKIPSTDSDQETVEIVTETQSAPTDMVTQKQETSTESVEEEFVPSKTARPELSETTSSADDESETDKPTSSTMFIQEASVPPEQTMTTLAESHLSEEHQPTTAAVSEMDKVSSSKVPEFDAQTEEVFTPTLKPLQPESSPDTSKPEKDIPTTLNPTTAATLADEVFTSAPIVDKSTMPPQKPTETVVTEQPRPIPTQEQHTDDILTPEEEASIPPSGTSAYGQEPDYMEEDQTFGPGTCRYGGKVYVSAQQIPRDDPCDFCFCFRSDIICLQQSCPPPIHGCHEEPIQGFCCPRYECPVSMATTVNVTTTTTTTTTTLPPHFPVHSYKGSAQKRGCLIKGHSYKVGEVVRASSGPCLHCTCGGDGQMKCDPKQCTPEPMLRQMIAAAVSAKRRR